MSKIIIVLLAVLALAWATPVSALTNLGRTKLEVKEPIEQKSLERKLEVTGKLEPKFTEQSETALERLITRVENRFAHHTKWLNQWLKRVTFRSDILKSQGKDTTALNEAIATAQTDLNKAKDLASAAVLALKNVTVTDWKNKTATATAAQEAVKTAEKAYAQVLKDLSLILVELRKLNPEPQRKPTST